MNIQKLSLAQETWLGKQIKPGPEIFVIAWAGTSFQEWKLIGMFTHKEYREIPDMEVYARRVFPSAILIRVFKSPDQEKSTELKADC